METEKKSGDIKALEKLVEESTRCQSVETVGEAGISLGVGGTGNCNLKCAHCYSVSLRGKSLGIEDFMMLIEGKKVSAINFGTGENILNPDFLRMVEAAYERGIKLAVTSNGYTIVQLSDHHLRMFNDVDISLDFGDDEEHNAFRHGGIEKVNLLRKDKLAAELVRKAIDRCEEEGIEFSITTALMNTNYREIPRILAIAGVHDCHMRLNIYKPVLIKTGPMNGTPETIHIDDQFKLGYDQFWEAVRTLLTYGKLVSCSEPIVCAVTGIKSPRPQSPCGRVSLRVHPTRAVVPCVYWSDAELTISDLKDSYNPAFGTEAFQQIRTIPDYCRTECGVVEACGGGCASRRYFNTTGADVSSSENVAKFLAAGGGLSQLDEYCPKANGREPPLLPPVIWAEQADLVHSAYLCTFIWDANVEALINSGFLHQVDGKLKPTFKTSAA